MADGKGAACQLAGHSRRCKTGGPTCNCRLDSAGVQGHTRAAHVKYAAQHSHTSALCSAAALGLQEGWQLAARGHECREAGQQDVPHMLPVPRAAQALHKQRAGALQHMCGTQHVWPSRPAHNLSV